MDVMLGSITDWPKYKGGGGGCYSATAVLLVKDLLSLYCVL